MLLFTLLYIRKNLKNMKIAFSTDSIQRGGKERQICILTKFLLDKGYNISILTQRLSKKNYLKDYNLDISIVHCIGKSILRKDFKIFKKKIEQLEPDLVVSFDIQTSLFNLILYRKLNYKFINGSIQHGIRLLKSTHLLRSFICWLSPFNIANSNAGLRANNLKENKKNFVLYNGIEDRFIKRSNEFKNIETLRKELIPRYVNCNLILISVANFVPFKDYFTVLKSLAILKKTRSFYYIIVGDGPMRPEIEKEIKISGLKKNVILLGSIMNVSDYLKISDIMIHSSRGEGASNAILEAMYAGLPVIATPVGGTPEIAYKKSFQFFNYKDYHKLAEILLANKRLFGEFDQDSKDYKAHLDKFSVETMIKNFVRIVNKVMNDS